MEAREIAARLDRENRRRREIEAVIVAQARERVETTYEPGFLFGFTDFDIQLDNISLIEIIVDSCQGDVNLDLVVSVEDLVLVILAWGTADPAADVTGDGRVDVEDLVLVILDWGPCPGAAP